MLPASKALRCAVLALSAFDYSQLGNANGFKPLALQYKSQSLALVRSNVDELSKSRPVVSQRDYKVKLEAILLAIVVLCISDITTGSTKEWMAHLHGALCLVNLAESIPFRSTALRFVSDYFLSRHAFSCTAMDTQTYFDQSIGQKRPAASAVDSLSESLRDSSIIDVHIGSSEELISIISSITALARHKYRTRLAGETSLSKEEDFLVTANNLQ